MQQLKNIIRWVFWLNIAQTVILLSSLLLDFVGGMYGKDGPESGSATFIGMLVVSTVSYPFISLMTSIYQFWPSVCLLIIFNQKNSSELAPG